MPMDDRHRFTMRRYHGKNKNVSGLSKDRVTDDSLEPVGTDSGSLTVRRNMGGGIYRYIHSRVDPRREAGIWADCQFAQNATAVILGCGLGYHLLEFLKRHQHIERVYLIEADESLFRLAVDISDISEAIGDRNVHFLIGRDVQSFKRALSDAIDGLFTYHVFLPATSLYPEFYASVIRTLDEHLRTVRLTVGKGSDRSTGDSFAAGVEKLIDVMKST